MMPHELKPLTEADFDRLIGIDREIIQRANVRRVDSLTGGQIVGRNGRGDYSGILFPYCWPGEDHAREFRLRRDHPEMEADANGQLKPKDKYLSPAGIRNMLYFPPGIDTAWLKDPKVPIAITEGEKKTLALHGLALHDMSDTVEHPRWVSIGLAGVWNWKGTIGKTNDAQGTRVDVKGVIPDFDRITWKGRVVKIIFDANVHSNEKVGWARKGLAAELRKRGALVSIVDLPQLPDINGVDDLVGKWGKSAVLDLIMTGSPGDNGTVWSEPIALGEALPPVLRFDPELLPAIFRRLVADAADRMQVPLDLVAIPLVVALSAVVGRRAMIQPKEHDDGWKVVPNLWGCPIAPPGFLKSPSLRLGIAALTRLEDRAREDFKLLEKTHKQELRSFKVRESAWQYEANKACRSGGQFNHFEEESPEPPVATRFVINDTTKEKLQEILAENPAGVALVRDELSGWFAQLDQAGRDGERSFMLETWEGQTSRDSNRISRGTKYCSALCVALLGGMQPDTFRNYVSFMLNGDATHAAQNDGLLQRLQLLVWPDMDPHWKYVDRKADQVAIDEVTAIFEKLSGFEHESPVQMLFDPEAQPLFVEWLTDLETRRIRNTDHHSAYISHLSKYRSLIPSLAGLFELVERVNHGETRYTDNTVYIGIESLQRAIQWDAYLESHANRAYAGIVTPEMQSAQTLSVKIREEKLGTGKFKARDVYLKGWRGLNTVESAQKAIRVLQDANWIRAIESPAGPGRPAEEYEINPRVFEREREVL